MTDRRGSLLRTVFFILCAALSLVVALPWLWISALKKEPHKWAYASRSMTRWSRFLLWAAGARVEVLGAENIPTQPALYVGNHSSYFDILICLAAIDARRTADSAHSPSPIAFVSNIKNDRVPLVRSWMRELGCIQLDLTDMRQQVRRLGEASDRMGRGLSYIVFPEGGRSEDGSIGAFRPGAFKLATRSKAAIQPFAIVGAHALLPKHSLRIRSGVIRVVFGRTISCEEVAASDTTTLCESVRQEVGRLYDEHC